MSKVYHSKQVPQPRRRRKDFPPAQPGYKYCLECEKEKPLTDFQRLGATSDKYRGSCKPCQKKRRYHPVFVQQPLFLLSKKCTKCGVTKDIEEFNKMESGKMGYHSHCRQCQSAYNHQHRINNLEDYRIRAHVKHTKPANRVRAMQRHRERSLSDPHYLELRKQHRQRYYQNHKEQAKDFYPRRKARILNATVGKVDYKRILERDGYICHICNQPIDPNAKKKSSTALAFDHVVPLQPRVGEPQGDHSEENIKPSHIACNVRKGNRPMSVLTNFDRRGPA